MLAPSARKQSSTAWQDVSTNGTCSPGFRVSKRLRIPGHRGASGFRMDGVRRRYLLWHMPLSAHTIVRVTGQRAAIPLDGAFIAGPAPSQHHPHGYAPPRSSISMHDPPPHIAPATPQGLDPSVAAAAPATPAWPALACIPAQTSSLAVAAAVLLQPPALGPGRWMFPGSRLPGRRHPRWCRAQSMRWQPFHLHVPHLSFFFQVRPVPHTPPHL